MSGLEAVGAIASIAQLCSYIRHSLNSIRSTLKYIKNLPKNLKKRSHYLDSLTSIVNQIASSPRLQMPDFEIHLKSVKADINELRDILVESLQKHTGKDPKSLLNACWRRSSLEERIANIFSYLERNKSSLQLYLTTINTYTPGDMPDKVSEQIHEPTRHHKQKQTRTVGDRATDSVSRDLEDSASYDRFDSRKYEDVTQTGTNGTAVGNDW